MATYGVGPSASRTNVGPGVNMNAKLQPDGKVYNDGVLVFNPAVDPIEQIAPDANLGGAIGSFAVTSVTVTLPGSITRSVYVVPKASLTPFALAWVDDTVTNSKATTGTNKVGAGAVVAAASTVVTQDVTNVTVTYNFATDTGDDQTDYNTGGSIATVAQADGDTLTLTKAAA